MSQLTRMRKKEETSLVRKPKLKKQPTYMKMTAAASAQKQGFLASTAKQNNLISHKNTPTVSAFGEQDNSVERKQDNEKENSEMLIENQRPSMTFKDVGPQVELGDKSNI